MRTRGVILPQPRGSGRIVPLMPLTEGADNELGLRSSCLRYRALTIKKLCQRCNVFAFSAFIK